VDATTLRQGGVGVVLTSGGTISGAVTVNNTLTATSLAGNGSGVSNLNGSYIASGTVNSNWLPSGSTTQTGIVRLENTVTSTSTALAATANAVKTAYDLANAALPKTGGTVSGLVTVNNTLNANTLQQNDTNISSLFASSTHTHNLSTLSGSLATSQLPTGCVVQAVYRVATSETLAGGSYTTSDVTISIRPKLNMIFVIANVGYQFDGGFSPVEGYLQIRNNGTEITTSGPSNAMARLWSATNSANIRLAGKASIAINVSPGSTSQQTYTVFGVSISNGFRFGTGTNTGVSEMIAYEIA
jgi:hypothetical protein